MCACITTKWLIIIVTIITISVGSGMNYLLKPIVFHLSKQDLVTCWSGFRSVWNKLNSSEIERREPPKKALVCHYPLVN